MTTETVLLIGPSTNTASGVLDSHAKRLGQRSFADEVDTATFETDPVRELRGQFTDITTERVYAVPVITAHTSTTMERLPTALSYISGDVRYCEPVGRSPAVTEIIVRRTSGLVSADEEASMILVSSGCSSKPYHRQAAEYHAARIRDQSSYTDVVTCHLVQDPAIECVHYEVSNGRVVAVPLFFTRNENTSKLSRKLGFERGNVDWIDPFSSHPRITDAIRAEVEKQRALDDGPPSTAREDEMLQNGSVESHSVR